MLSSSSASGPVFTEAGARFPVARALNASRLSDEETARSVDGSRSDGVPRLELLDRVELGGVARPDGMFRSVEIPRLAGLLRSAELLLAEDAFILSPKNPEDGCEPLVFPED